MTTKFVPAWTVTYGGDFVTSCDQCPHMEIDRNSYGDAEFTCKHPDSNGLDLSCNVTNDYDFQYYTDIHPKCPLKEN